MTIDRAPLGVPCREGCGRHFTGQYAAGARREHEKNCRSCCNPESPKADGKTDPNSDVEENADATPPGRTAPQESGGRPKRGRSAAAAAAADVQDDEPSNKEEDGAFPSL
jgi:hypothetical protein